MGKVATASLKIKKINSIVNANKVKNLDKIGKFLENVIEEIENSNSPTGVK